MCGSGGILFPPLKMSQNFSDNLLVSSRCGRSRSGVCTPGNWSASVDYTSDGSRMKRQKHGGIGQSGTEVGTDRFMIRKRP